MANVKRNKEVEKLLREYVAMLNKESKRLDREIERNTRCAPPMGATLKYVTKCESEQHALFGHMERLENIVKKLYQPTMGMPGM